MSYMDSSHINTKIDKLLSTHIPIFEDDIKSKIYNLQSELRTKIHFKGGFGSLKNRNDIAYLNEKLDILKERYPEEFI